MLDFGFYNVDCMEGMKDFPDKYFDLAIVDPPYGINALSFGMGDCFSGGKASTLASASKKVERKRRLNQGAGKLKDRTLQNMNCDWDFEPPKQSYFNELFRVSRNQVIWGGNYFDLPPTRGIVVWDKEQPWENFSQAEIAWTSFDVPAKIFRMNNGFKNPGKIHPTQKPVELYMWLIEKFAKPGDIILDTHVGSASSLIACHETNHKYVGFEIDPTYYADAKKRLEAAEAQMNIFDFIGGQDDEQTLQHIPKSDPEVGEGTAVDDGGRGDVRTHKGNKQTFPGRRQLPCYLRRDGRRVHHACTDDDYV